MTHSVSILTISQAAYSEIAAKLRAAGYDHVFMSGAIDLSGIAIAPDPDQPLPPGIVEINADDLSRDAVRRIYQLDNLEDNHDEAD